VPRCLVTTQRALRGHVPTAQEVVCDAPDVHVIDAHDPEMALMETSEDARLSSGNGSRQTISWTLRRAMACTSVCRQGRVSAVLA
jgi:hypothetical protein